MSTELPKAYDPSSVETEAYRVWTEARAFHAEPGDPGEPYSIVIPPPNVTAALHLGHALNNTLQDILTRWHRMLGDNTEWIPGTDHAGIATQTVVEKRVLAEEGKRRTDFPREEFVQKIQAWKDEYETRIIDQLKRMGCSCDWDRQAFTMDPPRAKAVREAFFQLFKDGLIYRGKRLVNWDPATQTALADDEVEMEEVDGHFYYLRYPLVEAAGQEGKGGGSDSAHSTQPSLSYITVATTRPETMLGDTAIAINPKDPRAAQLRGRKVRLPIVNREIPIIEDDYVVLPVSMGGDKDDPKAQFATGFLKVTPAHDPNDYEIGQRHKLPLINILAPDGTISDQHGWPKEDVEQGDAEFLLGLDRFEARRAVVEWFKKNNLLEEVKPYRHSVGHSYRSHVPIEPYLSDQWYCKVTDDRLAGAALRAIADDQYEGSRGTKNPSAPQNQSSLRFYPARYAKTFQSWHENIRDWCISRQLWWGHRIPVWKFVLAGKEINDAPQEWRSRPQAWIEHQLTELSKRIANFFKSIDEEDSFAIYPIDWRTGDVRVATRSERCDAALDAFKIFHEANEMKEWKVGTPRHKTYSAPPRFEQSSEAARELSKWVQSYMPEAIERDPDVLDTWFSSGLWPLSTLGWPEDSALSTQHSALTKWNPTSVLCTAREIITLWVSRMVMFNLYFLNRLPFKHVFIHAMIQDGEGRKMSKSLGNGVDPLDIIHSHGADAMRFTLASMATNTQDVRMPVERDAKTGRNTSPKFDLGRNFCNKLWNAARFAMMNLGNAPQQAVDEGKWSLADRWILSRLMNAIQSAEAGLNDYRFDQYAKSCYDFFWGDFCDWYLEAIKPAMKDPARGPQTANVLAAVLDASLRLLHPAIPFVTETIWWRLNDVRADRGLLNRLNAGDDKLLIRAKWPKFNPDLTSEAAEFVFSRIQEIVVAIRNVRNEYKVDPKKPVIVSICAPGDSARQLESNREIVELLATCTLKEARDALPPVANAAKSLAAGCEIYVEGLVDPAAEQQRLGKRREELVKQIGAMKGRLSNEGYIAKAPPSLVEQTRQQLADAEAELAKLS